MIGDAVSAGLLLPVPRGPDAFWPAVFLEAFLRSVESAAAFRACLASARSPPGLMVDLTAEHALGFVAASIGAVFPAVPWANVIDGPAIGACPVGLLPPVLQIDLPNSMPDAAPLRAEALIVLPGRILSAAFLADIARKVLKPHGWAAP